ncbi:MAG: Membrane protein [Acidobacteria bacterium]|nr:Membrane protein [Acidobacteriota bacterium]
MYDEPRTSRASRLAAALGTIALLAFVVTGPLHHLGWVGVTGAFSMLKWAVYGALASLVLAIGGIVAAAGRRTSTAAAKTALVMSLIVIGSVAVLAFKGSRVPAIHDVTTDTLQPPPFLAIVPLRSDAVNPVDYGGADVAAKQRAAFPDLAPLLLDVAPAAAFDRALAAARTLGWELVASDPAAGRIEATDTTFWFGFKDDVVVRVTPQPTGSRIDVRSLSRVGVGDLGANAARIRKYLAAVKAAS